MEGADFVVKTEGHCFLCRHPISHHQSSQVKTEEKPETLTSSIHSLQYLARYLKLDMRKVFSEEAPIPQHLLDQLEKSILKVELCDDCTTLYKTFSKVYRQLEKSQMEVNCCLNLIRGKLAKAVVGSNKSGKTDSKVGFMMTKVEIAEALRTEAMKKCSKKLDIICPRIKTQKLTMQQVSKEKLKIKAKSRKVAVAEGPLLADDVISTDDGNSDQDQMEYHANFDPAPAHDFDSRSDINVALKVEEGPEVSRESRPSIPDKAPTVRNQTRASNVDNYKQAIPPPINVTGKGGNTPHYIRDSKTGKYKCQLCTKEYSTYNGVHSHHNVSHLGGKYKCSACSKGFGQMSHYKSHYLNFHMAVRFKCGKCEKMFNHKWNLLKHQKAVHLG